MSTRATFVLLGVLAVVAAFVVIRDWRATEAEEDRQTRELVCSMRRDEGLPVDDYC